MREKLTTIQGAVILLLLQVIFRMTLILRRLNY